MTDGKDATTSATNLAIAALVSNYLISHGIQLDAGTLLAIGAGLAGFWGRWRAGGIRSILTVQIRQPKNT